MLKTMQDDEFIKQKTFVHFSVMFSSKERSNITPTIQIF